MSQAIEVKDLTKIFNDRLVAVNNIQGSVSQAQSAISSSVASLSSANTSSFNDVVNYEYIKLALTAIVLILAIVLLTVKRN
ncbi:MAG: hypothetical protein JRN06_03365 [Nitrososphaerota archaeon]|nr:hypothetical protein [Nitrososphaerota archaeon]MDG7023102.1 hypothetical protein [Nitrososphaerota archaeon]